jgi:hypothetical protein
MENLVGKKMKGFKFEFRGDFSYARSMDKHIGEIGVITKQNKEVVTVKFKEDWWNYLLPEALEHIIQDEPIVPELGEGILMEVSDGGKLWRTKKVLGSSNGLFVTDPILWEHARPIQPKKVTMEELEQLVGGKFEIVNK